MSVNISQLSWIRFSVQQMPRFCAADAAHASTCGYHVEPLAARAHAGLEAVRYRWLWSVRKTRPPQ